MLRFVVAFSVSVFVSAGVFADDAELRDVIMGLCENCVTSGEFRYRLVVTVPGESAQSAAQASEEIRSVMASKRKSILKRLENHSVDEQERKRILRAVEFDADEFRQRAVKEKIRRWNVYFAVGDAAPGGDRLIELAPIDPNGAGGGTSQATSVLQRPSGIGSAESVSVIDALATALTGGRVYVGQEPNQLGRLVGAIPQMCENLGRSALDGVEFGRKAVPGQIGGDEITCLLPEKWSAARIVFQLDKEKGVVPTLTEYDRQGRVLADWVSTDFFVAGESELWFPRFCTYRQLIYADSSDESPNIRTEAFEFYPDSVVLNNNIPVERFSIPLTPGTTVVNSLDMNAEPLVVQQTTSLSIDDVTNLESVPGLGAAVTEVAPPAKRGHAWFFVLNALVVFGLVWWRITRWRKGDEV